jgi:hypothetical protein
MAKKRMRESRGAVQRPRRKRRAFAITALAVATCVVAATSLVQVFTVLAQSLNPAMVLAIEPHNAVANARLGDFTLTSLRQPSDVPRVLPQVERLALRSFHEQGINPEAVRQLAWIAMLRGRQERSERLIELTLAMSRREVAASLYEEELARSRGDVAAAMLQADTAMRTSEQARDLLLPRMTANLGEPQWRRAIANSLAKGPAWTPAFWNSVLGGKVPAGNLVALRMLLPRSNDPVSRNYTNAIFKQAVDQNMFEAARVLLRYLVGARAADQFMISPQPFGGPGWPPFSWQAFSTGSYSAGTPRGSTVLTYTILPGSGAGVLARRLLAHPAGPYTFALRAQLSGRQSAGQTLWRLTCAKDNRELGRLDLADLANRNGLLKTDVTIPEDCIFQWLRFENAPNSGQEPIGGIVRSASLSKRNAGA